MNFYIADCHFRHENIIRIDNRPFADIYQMEEHMIMSWNAKVRKEDTVYILGDFCSGSAYEWVSILRQLNGKKVLIEGNHDYAKTTPDVRNLFATIKPYKEISDNGRRVILSHYPIPFYRHAFDPRFYMLCGHVHATTENTYLEKWINEMKNDTGGYFKHCGQIYNVGCMMPWMGYCPQTLDEIIKQKARYEKNINNQ